MVKKRKGQSWTISIAKQNEKQQRGMGIAPNLGQPSPACLLTYIQSKGVALTVSFLLFSVSIAILKLSRGRMGIN